MGNHDARLAARTETQRGDDLDEAELMRRVAIGDLQAFSELYDRYVWRVFGVAKRLLVDPGLAEDVTQDVFVTVWRSACRFDRTRGSLTSWMMTQAHGRAVDVVRREQAWRNRDARYGEEAAAARSTRDVVVDAVFDRDGARAARAAVTLALSSLTELERSAIEMAYFGGLTYRQVAEALGIPTPTAKSRIRSGLRRMAAAAD